MCHWHLGWRIPQGRIRRRKTLLSVLDRYTSSEEEQARPAPTTEDRVTGKRPLVADPSPAPTLPAESSQAPKRRRLIRITDDDDEEEEAAPSLV